MTARPLTPPNPAPPLSLFAMLFTLIGSLIGAIGVLSVYPNDSSLPPAVIAAPASMPTFEFNVNAVLHIPTELPTHIPTPRPTLAATADVALNYCGTAAPGATCLQPPAPRPTQAPYPSCADAPPGAWCIWTGVNETSGAMEVSE